MAENDFDNERTAAGFGNSERTAAGFGNNESAAQNNLTTADIANPSRGAQTTDGTQRLSTDAIANSSPAAAQASADSGRQPLFPSGELQNFRSQWDSAQGLFVDDPRRAVEQADGLVANTIQRLAKQFADERAKLEQQWESGENVSTEDLRQALRRYRDFFDRLLSL